MDHKERMRKMVSYLLEQSDDNNLPLLVEDKNDSRALSQKQWEMWTWAELALGSAKGVVPLLVSLADSGLISARISTVEDDEAVWVKSVNVYGVTFEGYKIAFS